MNKIGNQFPSIEQVTDQYLKKNTQRQVNVSDQISFQEILEQTQADTSAQGLKFSKHASMRLQSRNIELSSEQKERLETGAVKAGEKGIRESLVLVDSLAFIVNVPSKTVVTAMDQKDSTENIYTNIDGAVVI